MSLLGNGTLANLDSAYYGGGGGGGGSSVSTVTSTLSVEFISPLAGNTAVEFVGTVNMGNSEVYVSSLTTGNTNGLIDMDAGLSWSPATGALVGVSSINGAPPLAAPLSTVVGSVTAGSSQVPFNANAVSTVAGKCYTASITIDGASISIVPASGTPTVGDHVSILANTNVLGTIDLVSLSSMKGKGQPLGFSFSGPVVASGAGLQFSAYCNASATVSTLLVPSSPAWIVPLN